MYGVEKFTNNARGTLTAALGGNEYDQTLYLEYETDDRFLWGNIEYEQSFQRATLTHPSRPDEFEIVAIIARNAYGDLIVIRGIEETPVVPWPVGTLVEARVTAEMLGEFAREWDDGGRVLREVSRAYEFPNEVLVLERMPVLGHHRDLLKGSHLSGHPWPSYGMPVTGRTPIVSIGSDLPELSEHGPLSDGTTHSLPGVPGVQVLAEIVPGGWWNSVYLGEMPSTPPEWADPSYAPNLHFQEPLHIPIPSEDEWGRDRDVYLYPLAIPPLVPTGFAVPTVVTEVGFVSTEVWADSPGARPRLSVFEGVGPEPESHEMVLVDNQEMVGLEEEGGVFRYALPSGASRLLSYMSFKVEQPASWLLQGYFYWVGLPLGEAGTPPA